MTKPWTRPENPAMNRPLPAPDAIARLESLAAELASLEPELERWLAATTDAAHERERARRASLHLRLQVSRVAAVLAPAAPESGGAPWHGQERRGPQRATNVARLPERPSSGRADTPATPGPHDWEPF
ncbi:hypothetical protein FSC37_04960 [Piscinibacter aquaticus]|uniref:Uncharacterized protein n=1 Tax=Piscinibacter aquaticus TaxID=392597 RepID=A0A5C6U1J2_9BURK|nr:hypothetical protein FSC37_04960 [Piscinibacter aquaticus]